MRRCLVLASILLLGSSLSGCAVDVGEPSEGGDRPSGEPSNGDQTTDPGQDPATVLAHRIAAVKQPSGLQLLPPLEAAIVTSESRVTEYDSVSFTAEVSGGIPPYAFEWSFDGMAPDFQEAWPDEVHFTRPGSFSIRLIVHDTEGSSAEATTTVTVEPLEGDMDFFFGNLHSHSAVSDGKGSPVEVMRWARFDEQLDFYAMTDHAEQILPREWDEIQIQVDSFTDDGVFVGLRGFEWSHPLLGHINVFDTSAYTTAYTSPRLRNIYDWIEARAGIAHFNHPGRERLVFNDLELEPKVLQNVFGIETGNKRTGNKDGDFVPYYIQALDNGWHVAPLNNQDNHSLKLNSHRTVYVGEELTREHLLEAMRERRLYSSDDPDIRIVFKLEEAWMGSHVNVSSDRVRFSIKVEDNEPVRELQLISKGGRVVDQMVPEDADATLVYWFPEVTVTEDAYFFLRVVSEDLFDDEPPIQVALTAPIWIYR